MIQFNEYMKFIWIAKCMSSFANSTFQFLKTSERSKLIVGSIYGDD